MVNARILRSVVLAALCSLTGAGLAAAPAMAEGKGSCPNEALRTGFDASLPECRAYELVSPPGTAPQIAVGEGRAGAGQDIFKGSRTPGSPLGETLSASGERLMFTSKYAPAGATWDYQFFLASRGVQGWSTVGMIPPQSPEYTIICSNAYAIAFTPELTSWVLGDGLGQIGGVVSAGGGPEGCGKDEPELVEGEPQGVQNLFLDEGPTGPYHLIDVTPEHVQPAHAWFQAASSDLSHVVFDEKAQLTPEAPAVNPSNVTGGNDLYMWSAGSVRLVTILPNGTAASGALANQDEYYEYRGPGFLYGGAEIFTHAVSADGSRVFFSAGGDLYARENAYREQSALAGGRCSEPEKACTIQIDASQTGGGGGGGTFKWASADGSRAFFTDSEKLTSNSTAAAGKPDLYEYDFGAPEGARLTDLTVSASEPADVQDVSGVSEDGSHVYFVADGKLTNAANSFGATAVAGQPNLYAVVQDREPAFIATLDPTYDNQDWEPRTLTARVSENGRFLAFDSLRSLTGYDNTPVEPADCHAEEHVEVPCTEIFLYDAQLKQLSCVSCDPTGARPTAPALIHEPERYHIDGEGGSEEPGYLQRNVTDEGQVFFDTSEPLSPRATNGQANVYEYRDGTIQLLSTATSSVGAYFYEASASAKDVFLTTSQPLVQAAEGSEYSVYDARVDGGFPEPAKPTACSEEDCRGALTPTPLLGAPSSQTFVGAGNPVSAPAQHSVAKHVKPKKRRKRSAGRRRRARGTHRKKPGKRARRAGSAVRRNRGGVR